MNNFDFTDLILLVGTNPLPNYVVGKYFLGELEKGNFKDDSKLQRIWLVYTSQTKKYADNLEKEFKSKITIEKRSLSDEASAFKIRKDFREGVLNNLKGKTIHLNYTGGTKSMSVHSYIATLKESIDSSENELGITATYSYLNARGFNIYRDDEENPITGDLRKEIRIDLESLFGLHGYFQINNKDNYKQNLILFKQELENLFISNNPSDIIKEFKDFHKIVRKKSNGDLITKREDLQLNITLSSIQKQILTSLPSEFKIYFDNGSRNESINDQSVTYIAKLLGKGTWLEIYIEHIVSKLEIFNVHNSGWEIRDPSWNQAKNPNGSYKVQFELDVIALNGYQFIGVSCTTDSSRSLCKSKAFEISHRSKQIGGEEAKSILISALKVPELNTKSTDEISPKDLQMELDTDLDNSGNILILGNEDLKPQILAKKIEEFIKK